MFKVFEIIGSFKEEVQPSDGIYTVFEFKKYEFFYQGKLLGNEIFFVEDEAVGDEYMIRVSSNTVKTKANTFFADYFGFAKVSFGAESIQVNILIKKLKVYEVEEMLLYLFERNHFLFDKFISKSVIKGSVDFSGKEYVYSSKYLNFVEEFCNSFDYLYSFFKGLPHSVVRKKFIVSNYTNQGVDFKSIEWLLQNLDSVRFDQKLSGHPDSFRISNKSALIDVIGAEQNVSYLDIYENRIIVGSFEYVLQTLRSISDLLNRKIIDNTPSRSYLLQQYDDCADFRNVKIIPYVRLLNRVTEVEKKVNDVQIKYRRLFNKVMPLMQTPKLTPVFAKYKHYQKAYTMIRKLKNLHCNIDAEIQLLNVRKLSELYEIYNLNIILETIVTKYKGDTTFETPEVHLGDDGINVAKFVLTQPKNNYVITVYYEPLIRKEAIDINLITIGNYYLSEKAEFCKPDYVIEVKKNDNVRYCILDSKYSTFSTVNNFYRSSCIKKYLLDVGVSGNPYQKADYLVLVHPDASDPETNFVYNKSYFPQILTFVSKPRTSANFISFLYDFL